MNFFIAVQDKKVRAMVIAISLLICTTIRTSAQSPTVDASLTFSPETVSKKVGETFTTEISIDTAGAQVGGIGAKITFDPLIVHVENIETFPVFPDYPATTFDNTSGTMVISGIVNGKDQLYSGKGVFAKVSWKAKGPGTSNIQFNFIPNDTKDSNIAVLYGNGDILQRVNSVTVTVEGDPVVAATSLPPENQNELRVAEPVVTATIVQIQKPITPNAETEGFFTPQKTLAVLLLGSFVLHFFMFKKIQMLEEKVSISKPATPDSSIKDTLNP